jgi:hypothetical protein
MSIPHLVNEYKRRHTISSLIFTILVQILKLLEGFDNIKILSVIQAPLAFLFDPSNRINLT